MKIFVGTRFRDEELKPLKILKEDFEREYNSSNYYYITAKNLKRLKDIDDKFKSMLDEAEKFLVTNPNIKFTPFQLYELQNVLCLINLSKRKIDRIFRGVPNDNIQ